MAAKKAKAEVAADPDRLVRQSAGIYCTADERFEVRQEGLGWFDRRDWAGSSLIRRRPTSWASR